MYFWRLNPNFNVTGVIVGRTLSWRFLLAGCVLNYAGVAAPTPAELASVACRVLRFIDLGGHEKFMKTALYGMTCMVSKCH